MLAHANPFPNRRSLPGLALLIVLASQVLMAMEGGHAMPASALQAPPRPALAADHGQPSGAASASSASSCSAASASASALSASALAAIRSGEPAPLKLKRTEAAKWKDRLRYVLNDETKAALLAATCSIAEGTLLYHGTPYSLPGGMPDMPLNYFATDPDQARAHAIARFDPQHPQPPKVYVYKVVREIPEILDVTDDLELRDIFKMLEIDKNHCLATGGGLGQNNEWLGFIVNKEREKGTWSLQGVRHLNDQSEVQLPEPARYLERIAVEVLAGAAGFDQDPFQQEPPQDPDGGPEGRVNVAAMTLAEFYRYDRQRQTFKRWKRKVQAYLALDDLKFGPVPDSAVRKDMYTYNAKELGHIWKAMAE